MWELIDKRDLKTIKKNKLKILWSHVWYSNSLGFSEISDYLLDNIKDNSNNTRHALEIYTYCSIHNMKKTISKLQELTNETKFVDENTYCNFAKINETQAKDAKDAKDAINYAVEFSGIFPEAGSIYSAIINKNPDILEHLIETYTINYSKKYVMDECLLHNSKDCLRIVLRKIKYGRDIINKCLRSGSLVCFKEMIEFFGLKYEDKYLLTALSSKNLELIKFLVKWED